MPAPPLERSRDPVRLLAVIVVSLLVWASAFVAIRMAVSGYPPAAAASLRFVVSCVVAGAWVAAAGRLRWPRGRELLVLFLVIGVGSAVYHLGLNAGALALGAGAASIVVTTSPVFTALLAGAFLGERLGPRGWVGIAVALAGVALVSARGASSLRPHPAVLFFVAAAVAQSVIHVLMRRKLQVYSTAAISALSVWTAAAFLVPLAPDAWRLVSAAPRSATLAVLYLGVVPGSLGSLAWSYVLARVSAPRAAALLYLVPPLTMLLAWVALGERPGPAGLAGAALTIVGVALIGTEKTA